MLAYMQASPPTSSPMLHTTSSPSTNTTTIYDNDRMSLAVLPSSPVSYGHVVLPAPTSSPSKRPKLSLNTTNLSPLIRKGATSLRLETLSATSPTIRNTFQNAYSPTVVPGTMMQPPMLLPINTNITSNDFPSTSSSGTSTPVSADETANSESSAASISSTSTLDSLPTNDTPYKLPFHIRSALRNSPLPRTHKRKLSLAPSLPLFPAAKKVAFRAPLTEDITTSKYTLRHSDIESVVSTNPKTSTSTTSDEITASNPVDTRISEKSEGDVLKAACELRQTGDRQQQQETVEVIAADLEANSCPATPVAGRARKVLQWRWTLDPSDDPTGRKHGLIDDAANLVASA